MQSFKQYLKEAQENERILYIARGLPGSGKSYTINQVVPKDGIFSTDDFWGPDYNYRPELAGRAHKWNQDRAAEAMATGASPLGIDNTNITWAQIKPYAEMAQANGYIVKYLEADSPWWRAISADLRSPDFKEGNPNFEKAAQFLANKNVHNVPLEVIKFMLNKWQPTESLPNEVV